LREGDAPFFLAIVDAKRSGIKPFGAPSPDASERVDPSAKLRAGSLPGGEAKSRGHSVSFGMKKEKRIASRRSFDSSSFRSG